MNSYNTRYEVIRTEKRHTTLVVLLVVTLLLSGVSAVLSGIMEYRYQRMMNHFEKSTQEIRGLMK